MTDFDLDFHLWQVPSGEPSRGRQTLMGWDVGEVSRNSPLAIWIPTRKPHLAVSVFFFFSLGNILVFLNFILFFNFTILYWFCHISTWIRHRYTCVPHPEPSSLLPPHAIPLGRPNAPAPSIQYRASNLDWQFVSYIILYMFQCHSPNHPILSLYHRVHKTVLYISVSFAVSYTGLLLPSF